MTELRSTLTCPECGARSVETMPSDACQWFHECAACGAVLRPKPGHCCVFCSYGDSTCPPMQEARAKGRRGCMPPVPRSGHRGRLACETGRR